MKKIIILISTFLFVANILIAQKNQLECNVGKSLTSFIESLKENHKKGIIDQEYFDNLYVSIDNYPPQFSFKDSILDIPIKYISITNYSGYEKLLKNGVWVISLSHLGIESNRLIITYTLRKVILKKKAHLLIELSDSATFTYEYSCDNDEWILINTEYSGV